MVPLVWTGACAAAGAFFARSSSAQDLGGALGVGGDAFGVSTALPSASEADAPSPCLGSSLSAVDFVDFWAFDATLGAFAGLMGISGMAGIVVLRVCEAPAGREAGTGGGGMAEDGVVGCVESASDGACEVDGVSISEPAARVDACESPASVGVCSTSPVGSSCTSFFVPSSTMACSRAGKAKPSSDDGTSDLLLLFFCEALGGKGASATDSHGRVG